MNVLQVVPELRVGGVERGTVDLAGRLAAGGHKAVVISNGGEMVKDLVAAGAVHYQLPVHRKSVFCIISMIPKIARIIRKEKIDIVHARSRAPAWSAFFAARRTRCVFITTCHGYYKKHFFSSCMGWGKRVIVPSNVIGRHMIEDFGVPRDRIRLIPRSVAVEKFKFTDPAKKRRKEFNVGIIGRITPIKGHLDFIKAMHKASRSIRDLKVWIVGDAPSSKEGYKEQVKVLTRGLGLSHCTEFLGTQTDIPEIVSHLDLLVLATTTQEAFGRVIIEAQAAGVPVVATAVGGVVDIIEDGVTGLLVPPADPRAMADAAVKIFQDRQLAGSLARAAYEKVKDRYTVDLMVRRTLEVYEEAMSHFNILVMKFSSIGDIILSTGAVRALRRKFPPGNYHISFLVGLAYKEILARSPHIDELLVCDLKNKDKGIGGFWGLASRLRSRHFDMVIDLQNNRRSHLLALCTCAPDRYGYANNKFGFLLNHGVKDDKTVLDPVAHQFRIFKPLGIELRDPHLELFPTAQDAAAVKDFLKGQWLAENQKLVGINISASVRWESKVWPVEHIIRLCEELGRRDIRVVITGTETDSSLAAMLCQSVKNLKLIDACGRFTINQLACLIKECAVYISGDSAPLHIAACMDTPFVALFGPTNPERHVPPANYYAVIRRNLACSPCYKSKCAHRRCMRLITPEEVLQAIEQLMARTAGRQSS
ncbi:MAG TPA: lipopolysaccharide heptosyltransferase II [Candidatus Omnitrophota bacterium]|nr:lipopolysaccharide heptosyltransferase II [Candidatus Omnitrophota bacterium]MDD4940928.1 lipopolysaccharide heptosyltransferase II [Candidatus Omnitrophota bacterium]HQO37799.1 lipopolysaccharide heptosyltransferase II [Candidatus Omnitrophota bacterium]HQQ05644.1 lipopolysaccharide heptosyltransferase II [Candidatus Omnitrophota bacterium]